uniref:C2H2-type domain-containing protein n=1 Tax=Timema poppense TaxID=170557 RepID=A0A7R9CGW5_TIMPO|nr:unnamed protein product [Timema poppensis]
MEYAVLSESWTVPQNALLSLIAQWISRDINSRERSMRTLLTFVDWNTLDGAMISEHVDREPLYSSSEISLYFILQALVDNNLLFPKYQGIYQALQDKFIQFLQSTQKSNPNCDNTSASSEEQKLCKTESHNTSLVTVKTTKKVKRKLIFRRSRRRKEKLLRLRPMARLAALKVALISRHKKKLKIRETSFQGSDDENSEMMDGYGCHLCPHVSPDTTRLEQHLAEVHSMDVTYKCGLCGYVCQWNKDYYGHMKGHFPGPPFKCDSCDYTCERIGQVLTHRMKHSDERPHHCEQCGYSCRTKQNLLAHLRCHTTDRPFKCEICGRAFSMKNTLEQHLAGHNSDRPYLCDICGFSTKYLSHLIAHKRIHSGDVYRCSYPQCKYSTPKKSQLGSHARTHGAVRPHSCNICGRGFLEKSHLVRHERIHLEEKPFKCSQCEYASSRRDKLKEHFGRHHGENASAKVPYKARPMRGTGSNSSSSSSGRTNGHKTCQESGGFGGANNLPGGDRPTNTNHAHQPLPNSGGDMASLMMQHHPPSTTNNPLPSHSQPPAYPGYPPSLDYSHHKSDHQALLHQQASHHMLPSAVRTSQQAVAAMMLDPRFHHPNPGAYHPAPPVSMAAMVAQSGANQGQNVGAQHHQGEYPCMPLF